MIIDNLVSIAKPAGAHRDRKLSQPACPHCCSMSPNLRIGFRFLTAKKRAMVKSRARFWAWAYVTQATTSGSGFSRRRFWASTAIRIEDKIQDTCEHGRGGRG